MAHHGWRLKLQSFLIPNKPVSGRETSGSLFVTGQQMEIFFFLNFKVAQSCPTLLSMKFSRQEYWRGLPFSSPGDLPNPELEPRSPTLQADSSLSEPPGKPQQMELYSDMKKKEILALATPWMDCEDITLSETGQRKTNTACYRSQMESNETSHRNRKQMGGCHEQV